MKKLILLATVTIVGSAGLVWSAMADSASGLMDACKDCCGFCC